MRVIYASPFLPALFNGTQEVDAKFELVLYEPDESVIAPWLSCVQEEADEFGYRHHSTAPGFQRWRCRKQFCPLCLTPLRSH